MAQVVSIPIEERLSKLESKMQLLIEQQQIQIQQQQSTQKAIAHLQGDVNTILTKRGLGRII